MPSINLLPRDLAPKASFIKASGAIRKLTTLGVIALLVSLGVSIGLFLIISNRLKVSTARKEQLEQNIKALQATEQKLVLIKDRLAFASDVLARPSGVEEAKAIQELVGVFPEGVGVKAIDIKPDLTSASFQTQDSLVLTQMMATIVSSGIYKKVDLMGINFIPATGFTASFNLTN